MKRAVVFFAYGTEECEALITVDILRRAGIRVATASTTWRKTVRSSSKVKIVTDIKAKKIDYSKVDILVLPGGMPGTKNLMRNKIIRNVVTAFNGANKTIAAICAAPSILGKLGCLQGRNATCYPGFESYLKGANFINEHVVVDKNIITGSGLGNAIPFALEIVRQVNGNRSANKVANSIGFGVDR